MTPDEHQRERMLVWRGAFQVSDFGAASASNYADLALAEFDKRFPAPAAVDTDRERRENLHCVISDLTDQCREANTELAALREKARYWDAMWPVWYGQEDDAIHAARKVIDAGALK